MSGFPVARTLGFAATVSLIAAVVAFGLSKSLEAAAFVWLVGGAISFAIAAFDQSHRN